ncbi:hypothetical protein AU192_19860 [Mycobacterium lehmannii]|uniref:Cytochrome c oxidase assembly protein n=1 Tax=Mycobacterium lehmannii TaxID=2048550 RepID=A0A101A3F1_9MYCO|nr:cytochrome c oxidase assembly protein [Mycobacterium lehmannii]KUI12326.1 hypothetical protein AU192_19860 [Mycobacterium lehmannii]
MPDVTVLAHAATTASDPWWSILAIVSLCFVGALYGIGVQNLWQRRGTGAVVGIRNAIAFGLGLTVIALADSAPVRAFSADSFAGHMTQHMLLLALAGPLLGAGGAALPLSLALPHRLRRLFNRTRAHPALRWVRRPANRVIGGCLLFTCVLWLWHLPALFVWAERNPGVHVLEHFSFIMIGWLLFAGILSPDRHRIAGPLGFLLLFAVGMTAAALGAVLTFAPAPLYPSEVYTAADALADQQLAGLVMWIPMDVVLLGIALSAFGRWLTGLVADHPEDMQMSPHVAVQEVSS